MIFEFLVKFHPYIASSTYPMRLHLWKMVPRARRLQKCAFGAKTHCFEKWSRQRIFGPPYSNSPSRYRADRVLSRHSKGCGTSKAQFSCVSKRAKFHAEQDSVSGSRSSGPLLGGFSSLLVPLSIAKNRSERSLLSMEICGPEHGLVAQNQLFGVLNL